jgi:hypothetical protein
MTRLWWVLVQLRLLEPEEKCRHISFLVCSEFLKKGYKHGPLKPMA